MSVCKKSKHIVFFSKRIRVRQLRWRAEASKWPLLYEVRRERPAVAHNFSPHNLLRWVERLRAAAPKRASYTLEDTRSGEEWVDHFARGISSVGAAVKG